jgi:hypothetical protein
MWTVRVRIPPGVPGLPDRVGSRPPESTAVPTSGTRGGEWLKGTPYRGERYMAKSPCLGGGAPVRIRGARAAPPRNTERQDTMANAQLPTQEEIDQAMQALNATAGKIVAALNQLGEAAEALRAVFDKLLNIPTGGDDE